MPVKNIIIAGSADRAPLALKDDGQRVYRKEL